MVKKYVKVGEGVGGMEEGEGYWRGRMMDGSDGGGGERRGRGLFS